MPELKGSKTEHNLLAAFAGESQARNRYTFFADKAREEGYHHIAAVFDETARNEQEHAKRYFTCLRGGMLEITASYPAGVIGTTAENLEAAAAGENEEWTKLYPEAAEAARQEGFQDASLAFANITKVEKRHEERYLALLELVRDGRFLARSESVTWKCEVCGYIHEGTEPPGTCPSCLRDKSYFGVTCLQW
jgi:rubrerythrin